MKVVILAGGMGTRISEETHLKPKPMIEIGGRPILWHIMKSYSSFGFNEFIICLGYKGYLIKEYFANYFHHMSDITFDLKENTKTIHRSYSEPWKVTLVDTGKETMTGGRIKRVAPYLEDSDNFCLTYGDGLANVDLRALANFHKGHGKLATLTGVCSPARFGALEINNENTVLKFHEKPIGDGVYINGGFFVLSKKVLDYIDDDSSIWERAPLERLSKEGQLKSHAHNGFWQCMDTLRDKEYLENLWDTSEPPWKSWT